MALYMTVVMGGTPLGAPFIGLIGEQLGARWTLIIGGVFVLVGVGVALLVFRRLNGGADADRAGRSRSVRGSSEPPERRSSGFDPLAGAR